MGNTELERKEKETLVIFEFEIFTRIGMNHFCINDIIKYTSTHNLLR